jgi:predicted RNase H-like HicB family nuclease
MEETFCIIQEAASMQNADQLTELYIEATTNGIGEPMRHPNFIEMVHATEAIGAHVEATSNGTLLDADIFITFQCHAIEGDHQPI